jgi:hypothetical protein
MVKIRRLQLRDIPHIKELHDKYYNEFEFPDFFKFLSQFVITDENDEIVIAGGVRAIAESVIVTDQTKSRITIGRALIEAQRASIFTCGRTGIDELHAFVTNKQYAKHLVQHGFSPRSPAFSMKVL